MQTASHGWLCFLVVNFWVTYFPCSCISYLGSEGASSISDRPSGDGRFPRLPGEGT